MTKALKIIIDILVKNIEEGNDVDNNKDILTLSLSRAVDIGEITHEYACEIDARIGLNVFC